MSEPAVDGRVLRGARNRQAVVEAYLELVQEGSVSPTAQAVAERAGVSARSVFHHFQDMESLMASAAEAHVRQYMPLLSPISDQGPFTERLDAFVAQRALLAEKVLPVYRASMRVETSSPVVAARLAWAADAMRAEVERVFAPELVGIDDEITDALDVMCSIESWIRLRTRQGLSVEQATRVLASSVRVLLGMMEGSWPPPSSHAT